MTGRDLKRILRVPQAVIILIGIIVIPSLYAWFNIVAFWDPYSNTKEINVAVVNLDKGGSSDLTGELNVGSQVVAQLKENDQLGWKFWDKDRAMTAVKSGEVYATVVIPATFSTDILSLTTDDFVRPKLEYYVNEKANAIAPKITDVGATTLETQINSTFVSTVSETIAQKLEQTGDAAGNRLVKARDTSIDVLGDITKQITDARKGLTDAGESLSSGEGALGDARDAFTRIETAIDDVQTAIEDAQTIVADVQAGLVTFTDAVTQAYTAGSAQLVQISSKLNTKLTALAAGASKANVEVATALTDAAALNEATGQAIANLTQVKDGLPSGDPVRDQLETVITNLGSKQVETTNLITQLETLNADVGTVADNIQASADAVNDATTATATSAEAVSTVLSTTLPEINRAVSALSASAGGFSSALNSQKLLVTEAVNLLDAFEGELEDARTAGKSLDSNLEGVEESLLNVRTDVSALSAADLMKKVEALSGLDPTKIADFMAAPVKVQEKIVFPVPAYGSAMAPLFTNLSLWIAAFVLVVLLKQEVDTDGIKNLTVRQAYFGRWMLLAVINFFQALLVSIGNLVIGVQTANAVAFVATSVFIGFVYMALIYALAVSFGYVGKGVIILLVIMQIPGASGIYPIEMMPGFFRALFPFFPFTYGIDALRETIGGFYGLNYWKFVAVLALFAGLSFALGLFFRQRLGNFSRLFNTKLSDTDLFVSENVQVLGSRRRVTQIVQALTNRDAFRAKLARQSTWFDAHHLTILRLTLIIAVVSTAVLACVSWLVPDAKATVLALWGVLCLLVIGLVVALEYIKQNITFGTEMTELGEPALQSELAAEERATHSNAVLDNLKDRV
ncbi:YhgE/Pip family protein [Leucobacter sp. HY1908]